MCTQRKITFDLNVNFYHSRKIDECWLQEIRVDQMFFSKAKFNKENLRQTIHKFFKLLPKIEFVLHDWAAMRNRSSYTNYSLPELIYNFEGLHRSIYTKDDTKSQNKVIINTIHAVSPFDNYENLIKQNKHELHLRLRLQDMLLVKAEPFYSFLTIPQRKNIIEILLNIRNNAAHKRGEENLNFQIEFALIIFLEEMMAIMIFLSLDMSLKQIHDVLQCRQERAEMQDRLLHYFEVKNAE